MGDRPEDLCPVVLDGVEGVMDRAAFMREFESDAAKESFDCIPTADIGSLGKLGVELASCVVSDL
jgi:hypothetical protein